MEPDVDELLSGLDDDQRAAVTDPAEPLCILAGAGTGKTRVLTRRIAWRGATGAEDGRRVLALTFTRAAATELSTRLRALGVREGVRAGTFHTVAWAELRARSAEVGRTPPVLLDRPARLLGRLADLGRAELAEVAGELAWARARCIPLESYPAEAARSRRAPGVGTARVVELGLAYERAKRKRGVVDFDDLLEHLASAIQRDPELAATQRFRFAHLYVDEFQDLNPLQHRLLEAWRGGRPTLTVVGDPNQAIYGWNGSDATYIEQFTDLYPGASVRTIDRNHRSTTPILEVANAVLDAGSLGGVRLRGTSEDGPVPSVLGYADAGEEARAVARAVLDARVPGTAWGHQAVLARTNSQLDRLEQSLGAVGVPVRRAGRTPFHELPAVRAALRELASPGPSFAEAVARLDASLGSDTRESDDVDGDEDARALARLVTLADRYVREQSATDGAGFRAFLLTEAEELGSGDAVDLLTFHGAKGREWPTVHLAGLEEGLVPIAHARTATELTEERRLFHVACTRAERRLVLTWAARRSFGTGDGGERRPSPFLTEVAPTLERLRVAATPSRPEDLPRLVATAEGDSPDRAAGDALRSWRAGRARAAGITPAAVLSDAVLDRLVRAQPHDRRALDAVPGIRPLVLAGLAEEILAVLSDG